MYFFFSFTTGKMSVNMAVHLPSLKQPTIASGDHEMVIRLYWMKLLFYLIFIFIYLPCPSNQIFHSCSFSQLISLLAVFVNRLSGFRTRRLSTQFFHSLLLLPNSHSLTNSFTILTLFVYRCVDDCDVENLIFHYRNRFYAWERNVITQVHH